MTFRKTLAAVLLLLAAGCLFFLPFHGREVPPGDLPPLVTTPGIPRTPAENPIHLNTADLPLLMTLPEIGESRAAAIIAYRETHGPFRTVDELAAVEGIGPAILELVREYVFVE